MERYDFVKQKSSTFYLVENSVYTVMDCNFIIDLNVIFFIIDKAFTVSAKSRNYICKKKENNMKKNV